MDPDSCLLSSGVCNKTKPNVIVKIHVKKFLIFTNIINRHYFCKKISNMTESAHLNVNSRLKTLSHTHTHTHTHTQRIEIFY